MSVLSELRMQPRISGHTRWEASDRMRLLLSGLVIFLLLCGANLATPLYPRMQAQLGLGTLGTSLAFASYVVALMVALSSIGHWSDHIGRRAALVAAMLLGLVGALVFASAHTLPGLCLGRALQGIAVALATGASAASLRELLPEKPHWASRFTLLSTSAGVAIGPVLGGLLALLPGNGSTAFRIYAALLLLLLFPLLLVRARPAISLVAVGQRRKALAPRGRLIPARSGKEFWVAAFTGFLSFAIYGFILSLAPGQLAVTFGIHFLPAIGLLAGLPLLASALIQLRQLSGVQLQGQATVLMACGILLLLVGLETSRLILVVVAMILLGTGQGIAFRTAFAAAVDKVPLAEHARTVSSLYLITYLGSTLPVIGLGWAAGVFGTQWSTRIFLILAALMALALGYFSWRAARQTTARTTRKLEP